VQGLQGRAEGRRQTHQRQVGKQPHRQPRPQRPARPGRIAAAGPAERVRLKPGQAQHGREHQQDGHSREPGQHLIQHAEGAFALAAGQLVLERRHQGRRQRSLAQQASKQVGQGKGGDEGRGQRAGAEHSGDEDIAPQAEHARGHGRRRDQTDVA
jgi:hypothetical protein